MPELIEFMQLLLYDAVFVGVYIAALLPLAVYRRAAFAVLKRNFFGYFSNPTGYVFLCIFVLMTSFFAFWPHEFFNANLANLDQLNAVIPLVMLIFVPAITMSIWSEERRQGTDELLLTLPAGDFDIVVGKFLAAASIFSVSLVFSQFANYMVLARLSYGNLDTGLFFSTYIGYWMMGLSMLALGMMASFLTGNLTVGFILGVLFNVPLALASSADLMFTDADIARTVQSWSFGTHFDDYGRGVISLSSTVYFLLIAAMGLYVSMVLIGKRHWSGGRDGDSMLVHYIVRSIALIFVVCGVTYLFGNWEAVRFRYDATENKSASLSPQTRDIIAKLDPAHPIHIEAFISNNIPELYVQTKYDLISLLKEFDQSGGNNVQVVLHDNLELSTKEAVSAEDRFGITPRTIQTRSRGAMREEQIIMGAVFQSGLQKVVVPFFDHGIPVEYEIVRSVDTVAKKKKMKIGIVRTDAQMFGGFSMAGGQPRQIPQQGIVREMAKQYDVEEIDPSTQIATDLYDAMLVVQPSSLDPPGMENVIEAIAKGIPTAIFEDPRPSFMRHVPGTGDPKQSGGGGMMGMMGGQQRNVPKGDIQKLWRTLGLQIDGNTGFDRQFRPNLVWQQYNPYRKIQVPIPDQWIFASELAPGGAGSVSSESQVTSGLVEVLFPIPGYISKRADSKFEFLPLIKSGTIQSGTISDEAYRRAMQTAGRDPNAIRAEQGAATETDYILAAHIRGGAASKDDGEDKKDDGADDSAKEGKSAEDRKLNVIYVADIDVMSEAFLTLRARPDQGMEVKWNFENVTFLLNIFDELTGDTDYIAIRKRKPSHYTLRVVEFRAEKAREDELTERDQFQKEFQDELDKKRDEINQIVEKLQTELDELRKDPNADPAQMQYILQRHLAEQERANRRVGVLQEQLELDRDRKIRNIRREADAKISAIQNSFKLWAILLPPIPPLFLGVLVFVIRLLREREGVAKSRLR
jgi:ABC-2 type transport system permease protein